jgi:hypothetical protein
MRIVGPRRNDLLEKAWAKDPVGARYQVIVIWQGNTASHIFSAEKMIDGSIRYFDAQIHRDDASGFFTRASTDASVYAWRVDDAEPKRDIMDLLTEGVEQT